MEETEWDRQMRAAIEALADALNNYHADFQGGMDRRFSGLCLAEAYHDLCQVDKDAAQRG